MIRSKAIGMIASAAFVVGALSFSATKPTLAQSYNEYSITCTPLLGNFGYCTEWTGSVLHEYYYWGDLWLQTA